MEEKPEFFILAGPNGAGKSVNGRLFVPPSVPIFNGDLVFADLATKYPQLKPEQIGGGVAKALEDARDKALNAKADFAFESNYSSNMATEIARKFQEAGYKTTLVYFGLDDLKDSAARVTQRSGTGGHDVKAEVIKYNYEEGIRRVKKDLLLYDNVVFVETQKQKAQAIAIFRKQSNQYISLPNSNNWYKKHFEKVINKMRVGILLPKKVKAKSIKRKPSQ